MKVLSLCDGMSIAHIALERAGFVVDEYYAAEIKPIALKVTKENYPNTIHIGNVNYVSFKDGVLYTENGNFNVGHIDLMIFGSPCQSFSIAMNAAMRVGLKDKVRSGLFLECHRILKEVNPTWFLLENVASMKDTDRDYLSKCMGVEPLRINSKLVAPALRDRYYWTNIKGVTQPEDKGITLQSILTSGWTDRQKARALLVSDSRPLADKKKMLHRYKKFTTIVWEEKGNDDSIRYLNQTELERCQTVPEGYTKCLTRNEAADVLGDAFTVDVIAHILSFIKTQQNDYKEAN
jgi:site-specific DNA-cytosine methylase